MLRDRIKLKSRLQKIADNIESGAHVSDIGSDHAFIPIYLLLNRITDKILITDRCSGPVEVAKRNIGRFSVYGNVDYRIGDGLSILNDNELDNVIIAGMGGEQIRDILERDIEKAARIKKLILQPMNLHNILRKWLWENGFSIGKEVLVNDRTKIYNIQCVKYIGKKIKYKEYETYIGKMGISEDIKTSVEYMRKNLNEFEKQIKGYKKSGSDMSKEIKRINMIIIDIESQIRLTGD